MHNTFLNSQMGQMVYYHDVHNYSRQPQLRWVDLEANEAVPLAQEHQGMRHEINIIDDLRTQRPPLARLIPIQDTLDFSVPVTLHHEKSRGDVTRCLREQQNCKHSFSQPPLEEQSINRTQVW